MFPSGRFALRSAGELRQPGQCSVCGNGTCIEGYLDLDIYFEWEGNIYLCMNCVSEAIHVVGALLPKEAETLKNIVETTHAELKVTKEQLNEYRNLDANLRRLFIPDSAKSGDLSISSLLTKPEPEQINTVNTPSGTDAGESESKGPVKGRRPNDVTRPKVGNKPTINL